MIRFRRGTALLNKVVKQFDKAVADLDAAVEHISTQRAKIIAKVQADTLKHQARVAEAYDKESELWTAQDRANTVRSNIAKLMGAE